MIRVMVQFAEDTGDQAGTLAFHKTSDRGRVNAKLLWIAD